MLLSLQGARERELGRLDGKEVTGGGGCERDGGGGASAYGGSPAPLHLERETEN